MKGRKIVFATFWRRCDKTAYYHLLGKQGQGSKKYLNYESGLPQ